MNSFPAEILHKVFIHLPLFQRIECMLVCHHWLFTLDTRSLLYDVCIHTEERFNKFTDMIKRFPHRANQVEEIDFSFCIHSSFDKRAIPNIFPNLRRVKLNDISDERIPSIYHKPLKTNSPKSKIEQIADLGDCILIMHMISSDLCTAIKSLEIKLPMEHIQKNDVISNLKNMPALECLTLSISSLSIKECEILHGNLPSMKSFKLHSVYLIDDEFEELDETWFEKIEPAASVTSIDWNISTSVLNVLFNIVETNTLWCQYMLRKYTNLTEIRFADSNVDVKQPESINMFFRDSFFPFIQANAQHLKFLSINCMPSQIHFFDALDRFGCKINKLELDLFSTTSILENLGKSTQAKSIQTLSLVNITMDNVSALGNLIVLTNLSLIGYYEAEEDKLLKISMNDLLNSLPDTLKTLEISEFEFEFNQASLHSTSVESLSICCRKITNDLSNIITYYFPKLSTLSLHGYVPTNVDLSLPDHHLSSFSISEYGSRQNFYLSVSTDKHTTPRFYDIEDNDSEMASHFYFTKSPALIPRNKLDGRPIFALKCASISELYFRSYSIDLRQ